MWCEDVMNPVGEGGFEKPHDEIRIVTAHAENDMTSH